MDALLRDVQLEEGRITDPLAFHPQVTFLVGENGSGKSTILEALAAKLDLDAEGGDTVLTFAESFFNVARNVDANEGAVKAHGGRPLHGMSHGESFLTLVLERFYPDGIANWRSRARSS